MGRTLLVLKRSAAQQQALEEDLAEAGNPASPNYRKWLTPAQFGATYGLGDEDLQAVESWLEAHGLKIEKVPQARNAIAFSGSIDHVQAAFHTSLHSFLVNGERHYANIGSATGVPAYTTVQVSVTGGTTGFTLASSGNIVLNAGVSATSTITAASSSGFTGQVSLTCAVTTAISNPVDPPTCVISSSVDILSGSSGASAQPTVNTTAPSSAAGATPKSLLFAGGGVALCLMAFAGTPARRRRWLTMASLLVMTAYCAGLGCGGGSTLQNQGGGGTTAGTYTVTVTGTDAATGKLTANTTVDVTVN
jgi:hypothetical protein